MAAAARLLRERGFAGIGVADLAEAAGLTHGAVYSHFKSKDVLAAEAIRQSLADIRARWIADAGGEGSPGLYQRLVRSYVSRAHRDEPGSGCAIAAMGPDAARNGRQVRHAFSDSIAALIDTLAAARGGDVEDAREAAMAAVSTMVGAIVVARAVEDAALSDRILQAARKQLLKAD